MGNAIIIQRGGIPGPGSEVLQPLVNEVKEYRDEILSAKDTVEGLSDEIIPAGSLAAAGPFIAVGSLKYTASVSGAAGGKWYANNIPTDRPRRIRGLALNVAGAATGCVEVKQVVNDPKAGATIRVVYRSPVININNVSIIPLDVVVPAGCYVGWTNRSGAQIRYTQAVGSSAGIEDDISPGVGGGNAAYLNNGSQPYAIIDAQLAMVVIYQDDGVLPTPALSVTGGDPGAVAFDAGLALNSVPYINGDRVAVPGWLKRVRVTVQQKGLTNLAFYERLGSSLYPRVVVPLQLTADVGTVQVFDTPRSWVKAGWLFGTLPTFADAPDGTVPGKVGRSGYGMGFRAANIMSADASAVIDAGTGPTVTEPSGITAAIDYQLDYDELPVPASLVRRERQVSLYKPDLTVQAFNWNVSGPGWSNNAEGLLSADGANTYDRFAQTPFWTRTERRRTRLQFQSQYGDAVIGLSWRQPFDGNGRGPTLIVVDFGANGGVGKLSIKNGGYAFPAGRSSDPGDLQAVVLSPGHNHLNPHELVHIIRDQRTHYARLTDLVTRAYTEVLVADNGSTDTNVPQGLGCEVLTLHTVQGAFIVPPGGLEVFYDGPRPLVLFAADSITQGDQQRIGYRYYDIIANAVGHDLVANASMGGAKAMGCYYTLRNDLLSLRPAGLIMPIGTNNGDNRDLASHLRFLDATIQIALSISCQVAIPLLPSPFNGDTFTVMNEAHTTRSQQYPGRVHLIPLNKYWTVNGDGTTINTDLFHGDKVHPNDAGNIVAARGIFSDVPFMRELLGSSWPTL